MTKYNCTTGNQCFGLVLGIVILIWITITLIPQPFGLMLEIVLMPPYFGLFIWSYLLWKDEDKSK